jgi:hypothetical protein
MRHLWITLRIELTDEYPFNVVAMCSFCGLFENKKAEEAYKKSLNKDIVKRKTVE